MAFFFNTNYHELPTNYPLMINYMGIPDWDIVNGYTF